jgi:hypothetical protein
LPAAFLNAFVQRVLRGLYLMIVTRHAEQGQTTRERALTCDGTACGTLTDRIETSAKRDLIAGKTRRGGALELTRGALLGCAQGSGQHLAVVAHEHRAVAWVHRAAAEAALFDTHVGDVGLSWLVGQRLRALMGFC